MKSIEQTKLLIVPHNDDETLFAGFTVTRERPHIIIVYDSYIQVNRGASYCDKDTRRQETIAALDILLGYDDSSNIGIEEMVTFLGLHDDLSYSPSAISTAIIKSLSVSAWEQITDIWAPAYEEGGHDQHNQVANECSSFANHRYTTYTRHQGRTRTGNRFNPTPLEIKLKHRALTCYTSQITNLSCQAWFTGDLNEYYLS